MFRRYLVYERLCAAPPARTDDPAVKLVAEGRAMLVAAATALGETPGAAVVVCAATRLGPWEILPPERFPAAAGAFDGVLLVAPETGGEAGRLAAAAIAAGGQLLGPGPDLIALAADKIRCGAGLAELSPPSWPAERAPERAGEIVVKPRDGAGALFTVAGPSADGPRIAAALRAQGCTSELIAQPRLHGVAASVALLGRGDRPPLALPAARQDFACEDAGGWTTFRYRGGSMPLPAPWQERAVALALRAAERLPPWQGYLGIDMVLGDAGDFALDVNPRLTTSFLGYAALLPGRTGRLLLGQETAEDLAAVRRARSAPPIGYAP